MVSEGPVFIVGHYEVADGDISAFSAAILQTMLAARSIDGCLYYSFVADLEKAALFHLVEIWRDEAALDVRLTSEAFRETGRKVAKLSVLNRSVVHYAGATATTL